MVAGMQLFSLCCGMFQQDNLQGFMPKRCFSARQQSYPYLPIVGLHDSACHRCEAADGSAAWKRLAGPDKESEARP